MKNLFLIGATMGVGKTAVCQVLKKRFNNCVFLDGDWCWDADPFTVTEETKTMVIENISFLLNQFIHCSAYDNIIFCWVMHEQSIIDTILNSLDTEKCSVEVISLICSEETLIKRLQKDIDEGKRSADVIKRSISRIPMYQQINSVKIDTDGRNIEEAAEVVFRLSDQFRHNPIRACAVQFKRQNQSTRV